MKIPFLDRNAREQVERLFSRKMLGSVLVGKFIGDYAAITMTDLFGTHAGYILGILVTVALFIYWEHVERLSEKAEEEIQGQTKIDEFGENNG